MESSKISVSEEQNALETGTSSVYGVADIKQEDTSSGYTVSEIKWENSISSLILHMSNFAMPLPLYEFPA